MSKISILVCSRISGNQNFGLPNLLASLQQMSSNYDNFEVLIKFDTDDKKVTKILPKLTVYPFKVKYIVEPRGRGYLDLHVFYNRLFSQVDERSSVIVAMGDDFTITQKGWDELILSKINQFPDQIFIIHGRPHPPESRENYQKHKFYLDFDINALEDLYIIDETPLWSRKLLDICGGFGSTCSTDAWTLCLEYFLWHRCGVNRTIFLERCITHRVVTDEVDQQMSPRWWTDRANFFAFMRSNFYKNLIEQQALNIYSNIKMTELSMFPPPFIPKQSDFSPTVFNPDDFRKLQRRRRITRLRTATLNLLPHFIRTGLTRVYKRYFRH